MTRTPRWAAAAALALALTACGGAADDPTLDVASAPSAGASADAAVPSIPCATQAQTVPVPAGVGTDLKTRPKVPANSAAPATAVQTADVVVGTGATARAGQQVAVKYVGALDKTGKEFDASWNTSPEQTIPYQVCGQDVVVGFSVAPVGMKVGGRRLVRIPDAFGYPGGNPQAGIPAGAVITFVIDLVSVQ
jgi:peptidylprolyl isomerase